MRVSVLRYLLLLCLLILFANGCAPANPGIVEDGVIPASAYPTPDWEEIPATLPDMGKGYELYSWQVDEDWCFTLIAGTNRSKSFAEITSTQNSLDESFIKITVTSMDDLETLLKRLPQGIDLIWSGINLSGEVEEGTLYFTYPPEDVVTRINELALEQGIELHTLINP